MALPTEGSALPAILKSVDQIIGEEKRDMYFVDFGRFLFDCDRQSMLRRHQEHLDWFAAKDLRHASAAP